MQVGPVEGRLEVEASLDLQLADNVLLDDFGDGSSEAQDGGFGETLPQDGKVVIVLPKLFAPSCHAMDFVDDNFD